MLGEDGHVLDKEARIAQRRQRIEARIEAKKLGSSGEPTKLLDKADDVHISRSVAQTADSRARLDKVNTSGMASATDVRVHGDSHENERRIAEELSRQSRRQKLLYEAESSARQNAAVAMKWSALFDKQIPQELLYEIELQRDTCARIIASKDHLIREFKSELKMKDDDYVKALKRQAEDVDTLLQRMGAQFATQRAAYENELEEIEEAFMQEREDLLTANKSELGKLMEKRWARLRWPLCSRAVRWQLGHCQAARGRPGATPRSSAHWIGPLPLRPAPLPLVAQAAARGALPRAAAGARRRGQPAARPAARAGRRGLRHPEDQARDGDPNARAGPGGDARDLPA